MTEAPPPRRNQRPNLNAATTDALLKRWQPTDNQWLAIEAESYGVRFPDELRREIEIIIGECLFWQDFEQTAPPIKSVRKGTNKVVGVRDRLRKIGNLTDQLYAELETCLNDGGAGNATILGLCKHMPPRADANTQSRQDMVRQLLANEREKLQNEEERDTWDQINAAGKGRTPRPCPTDILRSVLDIKCGIEGYSKELNAVEKRRGGFDVLDAWTQAVRDLQSLMVARNYPAGASNNDASGSSPFVKMIAAIDATLPIEKQLRRNSEGALSQFIIHTKSRR